MPADLTAPESLWRDRRFVLLASARTISVLGNGFARVALAFAVLALPGAGPGRLSLVASCQALPQVVFILAGGVIADRMSRSHLMVLADVTGGVAYAGLAAMVLTGWAPTAAMCALAVVAGTATAMFFPAVAGVVPLIVRTEHLQRANAWLRLSMNAATLLGLSLSGVVVALVGPGWALAVDAASFLVSAALVRGLRLTARPRAVTSGWVDLRDGWREFASRQWLWVVVVQFTFVVAGLSATNGVLGPLAARSYLGGAHGWSFVVTAQAIGTLLGAGLAVRVRVRRPILVAVLLVFPCAVPAALLAVRAPLWALCAAMFCSGMATDVFGALWAATMQREIPDAVLSRVSSYDAFGSLALAPLSLLVAGPLTTLVGLRPALETCSLCVLIPTALAVLSPQVRTLRTPEAKRSESHRPKHDEGRGELREQPTTGQ
jgi:MFS family permease